MLGYEDVMKVRRLEKSASRLVRVDKDFFSQLGDFVSTELAPSDNFSLSKAQELENLKNAVMDIYNMRQKKILSQALVMSRTGNADIEHMSKEELDMFNQVVGFLKSHKGNVLAFFEKNSKKEPLNKVSVLILGEVSSFVGEDLREYGPFGKDSVEELPKYIADLLVSRKLAEVKI